jgi:high frequency lysogenization protein
MYTIEDKTLALAGIYQPAYLVQQIATNGQASGASIESSLETLFKFDSNNVLDVYGGIIGVNQGLKTLVNQMSTNNDKQDMDITRYVVSILHLEKKLKKNKAMAAHIANDLEKAKDQMDYFSLTHENVLANLGNIYQETISTLLPRIQVQGEQNYLSQQSNANKIRALLLAGIRSAVLWRQCGGNRLQFLLGRKKYLNTAQELIKNI